MLSMEPSVSKNNYDFKEKKSRTLLANKKSEI